MSYRAKMIRKKQGQPAASQGAQQSAIQAREAAREMRQARQAMAAAYEVLRTAVRKAAQRVDGVLVFDRAGFDDDLAQASAYKAAATRNRNDALGLIGNVKLPGFLRRQLAQVEQFGDRYDDLRQEVMNMALDIEAQIAEEQAGGRQEKGQALGLGGT